MVSSADTRRLVAIWIVVAVLGSVASAGAKIIYVDADAPGANNGTSWVDGYKYLQDALADANSAEKPVEIRVACGIYKPDQGIRQTPGDRTATFQLINGVAIIGGYAGSGEPDPDARDVEAYEAILSGDLAGDDVDVNAVSGLWEDWSRSENSLHVVTGSGTDETVVLDGMVITGGSATPGCGPPCEVDSARRGGGLYIEAGSLTIRACIFRQNRAVRGGGMYARLSGAVIVGCKFICNYARGEGLWKYGGGGILNEASTMVVRDCAFRGNMTYNNGGGILNNDGSDATITDCTFMGNSARAYGGGMSDAEGSSLVVTHCEFVGNSARHGGGMYIHEASAVVRDCEFVGNSASNGGAIECTSSTTTIRRCRIEGNVAVGSGGFGGGIQLGCGGHTSILACAIRGNTAQRFGGGISCDGCSGPPENLEIVGCIITGNRAGWDGGGILCHNCTPRIWNTTVVGNRAGGGGGGIALWSYVESPLSNCIFWDNRDSGGEGESAQVWVYPEEDVGINHNCVDALTGALGGTGNIGADPCFAEAGYWDPNGTSDDPNDDFWVDGEYHLKSEAARWDPATHAWIADDVTSPCIDAGDPRSPIGPEPFPNGGVVNMGAYGGTAEASKSYFGEPVCETIVAGDINGDCKVDFSDSLIMASHWLEDNTPQGRITTTYEFLPDKSSIVAYCGRGGTRTYSIEGPFRLTVNLHACRARFEKVDATLSKEIRFVDDYPPAKEISTQSLNVLFHMTELISTDVNDTSLSFVFYKNIPLFPGADVDLRVVLQNKSARLAGTFGDAVYDGCWYDLNAVAIPQPMTGMKKK
ncbi:MAG: right-handed parallel beta-helix repeat-containing protein [Phycisphaerales bacterium]|nr:MAG: right-handed parallel beta-helix repeat-containing protein [Phycisphaerales bacterium]